METKFNRTRKERIGSTCLKTLRWQSEIIDFEIDEAEQVQEWVGNIDAIKVIKAYPWPDWNSTNWSFPKQKTRWRYDDRRFTRKSCENEWFTNFTLV